MRDPKAAELAELTVAEVRALLEVALPLPPRSIAFRMAWSRWRRRKRKQARDSYHSRPARQRTPDAQQTGAHLRLYY
ncbi:MAG: hypothetical protein ABFE07_22120 [Armatimonadia bacterium]